MDNNADGLVDERAEGIGSDPTVLDPSDGQNKNLSAMIAGRLQRHRHRTARAEVLYALLIEGIGPMGSSFGRDEFTDRQVQDTDGDGLPEFVDAWGEPLQFYRWPVHFTTGDSSLQRGWENYPPTDPNMPREQDPIDPNNSLVTPAWWSRTFNAGSSWFNKTSEPLFAFGSSSSMSTQAAAFMYYFHPIAEYDGIVPGASDLKWWDRSRAYPRRAYYTRPLIVSGGTDRKLGLAQLALNYADYGPYDAKGQPGTIPPPLDVTAQRLVTVENTAARLSPYRVESDAPYFRFDTSNPVATSIRNNSIAYPMNEGNGWFADDITNQNPQSASGGVQ